MDAVETPTSTEEHEQVDAPKLKFIFWEHVPQNAKEAAALAGDSEVIALEFLGFRNEKQRRAYEQAATTYISSTASDQERRMAGLYLRRKSDMFGTYVALLKELQGSNKQVVTLDLNRDDPEYALSKKTDKATEKLREARDKYRPSSTLRPLLIEELETDTALNEKREERIGQQLDTLVADYAGRAKSIAVFLGAYHTSVFHEAVRKRPNETERSFISNSSAKGIRFTYDNYSTGPLARQLRLRPGQLLSESALDRAVLDASHQARGSERALSDDMSDEDVAALLAELDRVKSGLLSHMEPIRTMRANHVLKKTTRNSTRDKQE